VLPSWFSFAAALICARDKLLSMIDEAKGINAIPESEEKSIASLVPFMMLISGPSMRPGQIYSARKPGCGAVPSKKENYIQMSYAYVDSDNGGPQEKVYMFHAYTSLFKFKKFSRHKAVFFFQFLPNHIPLLLCCSAEAREAGQGVSWFRRQTCRICLL